MKHAIHWRATWLGVIACVGCVEDLDLGQLASSVQADDSAETTSAEPDAAAACEPVRCTGQPKECADCIDNDGDGLLDHEDPDCWGPCDESEAAFSGGERQCVGQACFFQRDCGTGNDEQCLPLVPNGCDCRGCCMAPGRSEPIYLGSLDQSGAASCSASSLDDPDACQSCELDETCFNPCDDCELCFAQSELDPACASDSGCTAPQCDDGVAPCGGCAGECPSGLVCITGCCVAPP